MEQLDRITQQPEVMGGKACIRGMRVTVGMIVGQIGAGHSIEEIRGESPYLEREACWSTHETARRYESDGTAIMGVK